MPDIIKCIGGHCPFAERCYRKTSPASDQQSWFMLPPYQPAKTRDLDDRGSCEQFMPVSGAADAVERGES